MTANKAQSICQHTPRSLRSRIDWWIRTWLAFLCNPWRRLLVFDNSNKKWSVYCLFFFSLVIQCLPASRTAIINSFITGTNYQKGKTKFFLSHSGDIGEIQWARLGSSNRSIPSRSCLFLSCRSEHSGQYCCSVFWGILTLKCISSFTESPFTLLIPVQNCIFMSKN